MRRFRAVSILMLLVLAACADPAAVENPRVDFRTDRTTYALGDGGELRLQNLHTHDIVVNPDLCPTALLVLREEADEWEDRGIIDGVCQLYTIHLPPGAMVGRSFAVDVDRYEVGRTYRFGYPVGDGKSGGMKFSNPFTVTAAE